MATMAEPGINLGETYLLTSKDIPPMWPMLERVFREHPRGWAELTSLQAIYNTALTGNLHVWVTMVQRDIKLVALACPEMHVFRSSYAIVWCGGVEFKRYGLKALNKIEQWAQLHGFYDVTLTGRRGWMRMLKAMGYKEKCVHLSKLMMPYKAGTA